MIKAFLFLTFATVLVGCRPLTPPARPPLEMPDTKPTSYVSATRGAAECVDVVARSASWTSADIPGLQRASLRAMWFPPAAKGRRTDKQLQVRIRVGEQGTVMKDSVFVTGYAEAAYLRELRDAMQRNVYWPAVFEGCAVRMVTTIVVTP